MRKTLLIIHTPPPYGGGEIQAQFIKENFKRNNEFYIYDYSRKNHSRADWESSFNLKLILSGIWWIIKVVFLLIYLRPKIIYFTLPKSLGAFMRNACIIPFAKLFGTRIFGELPGTSFLFLEKGKGIKFRIGLFFLRRIDQIRFLSPRISDMHLSFNLKKHVIIENGILQHKRLKIPTNVFTDPVLNLLYVGAIERSKGIFNSLQALRDCRIINIKIHFHIIGSWTNETEKTEAESFINTYNLAEYITFHGVRTGNSKWDIFKRCAILLHPTYWDGVPLTILEALSIGLPVISTNVGGIPDTISHKVNGIILDDNTPEALCHAISFYYNNRLLMLDISKRNRALFKERYDLPIFLSNMEEWFNG